MFHIRTQMLLLCCFRFYIISFVLTFVPYRPKKWRFHTNHQPYINGYRSDPYKGEVTLATEVARAGMPLNIPGMPPRTVDVLLEIRARAAEKQEAQKGLDFYVLFLLQRDCLLLGLFVWWAMNWGFFFGGGGRCLKSVDIKTLHLGKLCWRLPACASRQTTPSTFGWNFRSGSLKGIIHCSPSWNDSNGKDDCGNGIHVSWFLIRLWRPKSFWWVLLFRAWSRF